MFKLTGGGCDLSREKKGCGVVAEPCSEGLAWMRGQQPPAPTVLSRVRSALLVTTGRGLGETGSERISVFTGPPFYLGTRV